MLLLGSGHVPKIKKSSAPTLKVGAELGIQTRLGVYATAVWASAKLLILRTVLAEQAKVAAGRI